VEAEGIWWVRPPVPKSTMDKNEPRRNSAGFAR
jgi:hypothetical protein